MADRRDLVKTLDFQLNVHSDNERLLRDATQEARDAYNEAIRLAKSGVERKTIPPVVADSVDLVKNTSQRIVAKAFDAMENASTYDKFNQPSHTKSSPYPLRMNYEEGYKLELGSEGKIRFRISAKPYKHVTGHLEGHDAHLDTLKSALASDKWEVGTAEALFQNSRPELHITVRNTNRKVRAAQNSRTVIGIDVNEDNVALTALSENGIQDTLVIDFPEIKFERHQYLKIRKRAQKAGKTSIYATLENQEKQFVRDRLHKLSRTVVDWCQQFRSPCIVFEDLEEIRDSIDYGTRMNHRLHHLPFRMIQFYTSYKAAFEGIPTVSIDPQYTSQRCPVCNHKERTNRKKDRFKCRSCSHQDHADRNASINICIKGVTRRQEWTVPALNNLPQVRKVRRQASGRVDQPTVTPDTVRGNRTDGVAGVSN